MTDLQARISGVVLNRLADYGIDMIAREIADSVAEAVMAMPGTVTVELPEAQKTPEGYRWQAHEETVYYERDREFKTSIVMPNTGSGEAQGCYTRTPRLLAAALLAASIAAEVGQ